MDLKKIGLTLTFFFFSCFPLFAEEKALGKILVLSESNYIELASHLTTELRNKDERKATLNLMAHLYVGIKRVSLNERILQLMYWVRVREGLEVRNIEHLLTSNIISVLITDTLMLSLADLEQYLPKDENGHLLPSKKLQVLVEDFREVAQRNMSISLSLRPFTLKIVGAEGDTAKFFAAIVKETEKQSEASYIKRWGENVVEMRKAAGKSLFPKGLAALCNAAPNSWGKIVSDPESTSTKAYFAAVDLYTVKCLSSIDRLMRKMDIDISNKKHNGPLLWGKIISLELEDLTFMLSEFEEKDVKGQSRNRLFLLE